MRYKSILIFLLIAAFGCAKKPYSVDYKKQMAEDDSRKRQKVFLIAAIKHPVTDQSEQSFYRKTLGVWRDLLIKMKDGHYQVPMVISVSGNVTKKLWRLKQDEAVLSPLLTLEPKALN
ncbi:hypothetical protein ACFLUV_07220, partial [Elusimicrobiota bacterium]